jgi:hypothetical protein
VNIIPKRHSFSFCVLGLCLLAYALRAADSTDFNSSIQPIFQKHCLDCHAAADSEKGLVLENFETLMKGGDSGKVIVPGKSSDSLLMKFIEGRSGKEGKNQFMPPGKNKKLEPAEVAAIKAWIDAGALAPKEAPKIFAREIIVPKIIPKVAPRKAIHALAVASGPKVVAVARYGEVELRSTDTHEALRTLTGHRGHVNAVAFSTDGKILASAAGEPALFGEVKIWNVADGKLIRTIEGHADALYSVAISPDGKILATGSYDQKIKLWNIETGVEIRTLSSHNGAIYSLSFRPDGKVLASASADRTVKLFEVATGKRLDTLSQSAKVLYTVAFSPDGQRLVAGGIDSKIRVWRISPSALDGTNEILESRFAHEGPILKLAFSSDGKMLVSSAEDRTVKLWDASTVTEKLALEAQPDQVPALGFMSNNKTVVVGRLDGTLEYYDTSTGKIAKLVSKL